MTLVSEGAAVQGRVLIAPSDTNPILTPVHVSASPTPGAVFVTTILVVLTFGSGWMRGWSGCCGPRTWTDSDRGR